MGLTKLERRSRIKRRIRKVVRGTLTTPRLSVFRSNKQIYAQLIDDDKGNTLASASSLDKELAKDETNPTAISKRVGHLLALRAKEVNVEKIHFDRSGYRYHGRVRALAEGARQGGLIF